MISTTERNKNLPMVVQIDGGIGRGICATAPLEELAKRNEGRKLILLAAHSDIFQENPYIHRIYKLDNDYLWEDVIRHGEFIYPEPYHSYLYYHQHHHLSQTFNYLLNGVEEVTLPHIYLTKPEIQWGEEQIAARREDSGGKPVAIIQVFGAGAGFDNENNFMDGTERSLPPDRVDLLMERLSDTCIFINASHIRMNYGNVWQDQYSLRQLFSLIRACNFLVGVDSFAMHAGAAFGKQGVMLLGGTYAQNVGYPHYITISREGYPKTYMPNRFGGKHEKCNERAMCFSDDEMGAIADKVKELANMVPVFVKKEVSVCDDEVCTTKHTKKCRAKKTSEV